MHFELLDGLLGPVVVRFLDPIQRQASARAAERVAAGSPHRILDVAVISGASIQEISERTNAEIISISPSGRLITGARKRLPQENEGLILLRTSLSSLPFAAGCFDAALCTLALNTVRKGAIEDTLKELVRVIAPGGRLVLGMMEFSSGFWHQGWSLAHSVVPLTVAHLRPVDPSDSFDEAGIRVIKEEVVSGLVDTRVITLVKAVG